ncbi:MAG: sulfite exporter TauE/SafE family protein [Aquincola sp.]|nr:sulfite exporter TauE/SafE family protein [Aquincola sp.]MDH5330146.1 sulfite exporter TauE/SafE family protein [Aquincola sp.]
MTGVALVAAAGAMGLAGLPHCAAMCAAPCIAVTRGGGAAQPAFQIARVAGYAAAGALAAVSVGALREGLAFAPALRPLWTLLHLAALAFGLWMLATGRWPAWMQRTSGLNAAPQQREQSNGWQRVAWVPLRSACAGAAWIAWPCALSQSALLVAALGDDAAQGATAMAAFAIASSPALWIGPWLAQRWRAVGAAGGALAAAAWPVRAAGAVLAAGSAWALGHGLWAQIVAWCT